MQNDFLLSALGDDFGRNDSFPAGERVFVHGISYIRSMINLPVKDLNITLTNGTQTTLLQTLRITETM